MPVTSSTLRRTRQDFLLGYPAPQSPMPRMDPVTIVRRSTVLFGANFFVRSSSRVIRTVFQLNMQLCNRVE